MDEDHTQPSGTGAFSRTPHRPASRYPSTSYHPHEPRLFNRHQRHSTSNQSYQQRQPVQQQTQMQQPLEVSLDRTSLYIMTALLNELQTRNSIDLMKMKREIEEKQKEAEAAEKVKAEDAKRFDEIKYSLYR